MPRHPKKKGKPSLLEGFRSIQGRPGDAANAQDSGYGKDGPPALINPSANLPGGERPQAPEGSPVVIRRPQSPTPPPYLSEVAERARPNATQRPAVSRRAVVVDRESVVLELTQNAMVLAGVVLGLLLIVVFLGGAVTGTRAGLFSRTAAPVDPAPVNTGADQNRNGVAATATGEFWIRVTDYRNDQEPQIRSAINVLTDRGFANVRRWPLGDSVAILAGPYTTEKAATGDLEKFRNLDSQVTQIFQKANLRGAIIVRAESSR